MTTGVARSACVAPVAVLAALAAGCVSPPAPKYQPSVDNVELIHRQSARIAVGSFTAAPGVENHSLGVRGSALNGGSDGTFSTYLRDSAISELQAASRYDEQSHFVLTGVLTQNALSAGVGKGSADVGVAFVLSCDGTACYRKSLLAHHEWESSFLGAIAIPAAMNNYPAAIQALLNQLFSDQEFRSALAADRTTAERPKQAP